MPKRGRDVQEVEGKDLRLNLEDPGFLGLGSLGSGFRVISFFGFLFLPPNFLSLDASPYSQSKSLSFILALRSHHCPLSRYQRDNSRTTWKSSG